MEPLASFTDYHPDICILQYETYRLSYTTTEDTMLQCCKSPTDTGNFSNYVVAVSDSKVIVDGSEPLIEPDGVYS